jgi:hypothetical protein
MSEERAKGLEDERLVGGRKECEATDDIADDGLRGRTRAASVTALAVRAHGHPSCNET